MITKAFFLLCFVALLGQLLSVPSPQQPGKKGPHVFQFCYIFNYYLTSSKLKVAYYGMICLRKKLLMYE